MITTALAAGASAAITDTTGQAIKDAYRGLGQLVRRRMEGEKEAEVALEEHEARPELWQPILEEQLVVVGADRDETIIRAAQALMALLDPDRAQAGKYHVVISGPSQGTVIGEHAQVTQTFGQSPN